MLPLTALFALAKLGVHTLDFEPWEFDSLTGSLFGASTFVLAFVLSGTLAAYSASEDMVAQFRAGEFPIDAIISDFEW